LPTIARRLLAAARAKPAGLTYGSAGIDSAQHLAAGFGARFVNLALDESRGGFDRSDRELRALRSGK
jgi:tripartite-type tricarboxylate transporter receptor subunit TctC